METFVEITNSAKVRSNSNLVISGIKANKSGWAPYSFYPNKGVVGVIIGEAQSYEGTIYIVQCGDRLLVPILPEDLKKISHSEFSIKYPKNKVVGKATDEQNNCAFDVKLSTKCLAGKTTNYGKFNVCSG